MSVYARDRRYRNCRGFTLVELGVSLAVIGLILGVILTQTSLFSAGNAIQVTGVVQDLVKATAEFRNRYKFLPGDFPATKDDLPNVIDVCTTGNSKAGNGNGIVDAAETEFFFLDAATKITCVGEHLFRAGLIRSPAIVTRYGPVRIVSRAEGQEVGHPPSVRNVIELCMIPGDITKDEKTNNDKMVWGGVAKDVDGKIDDGKDDGGAVRWKSEVVAPWCSVTNKVPLMSVALR